VPCGRRLRGSQGLDGGLEITLAGRNLSGKHFYGNID